MTSTTAGRAFSALALAVALAALPAIYALARTDPSSGGRASQMMGGCGEMMNDGMADRGMMGGSRADHGGMMNGMMGGGMMNGMMGGGMMNGMMGGGERPNQQWRR